MKLYYYDTLYSNFIHNFFQIPIASKAGFEKIKRIMWLQENFWNTVPKSTSVQSQCLSQSLLAKINLNFKYINRISPCVHTIGYITSYSQKTTLHIINIILDTWPSWRKFINIVNKTTQTLMVMDLPLAWNTFLLL